ncbi:MAG TPA: TetR/AcrR family transcriptional regulator [Psychromonas hadalis]|nr:TetR/AcrR family transcriptional regulator [Psychromonas hadalis]
MAKNSQKNALLTEQKIHQAILDIFLDRGWDAVTYGSIAKYTGLSRGGVQRVVPSKEAMSEVTKGKLLEIVTEELDFENEDAFVQSWMEGLQKQRFSNSIKYLVIAVSAGDAGRERSLKGLEILAKKGGITKGVMRSLLGFSVYHLLELKSPEV